MILYLLQSPIISPSHVHSAHNNGGSNPNPLTKTLFIPSFWGTAWPKNSLFLRAPTRGVGVRLRVSSSLLESPVLWAGRVCLFYALLKSGLAGSISNPIASSEMDSDGGDLGFSVWIESLRGGSDNKEANDRRKLVGKWHPTTKGTLRRNYRVPSKSVGRHLLKAIASLLSDDDHFVDSTSHKGCQIRRESAHGETVCCNNVRALFDELPTPHLLVEISAFPAGPLTDNDYVKAEKLERVLRSSSSI